MLVISAFKRHKWQCCEFKTLGYKARLCFNNRVEAGVLGL